MPARARVEDGIETNVPAFARERGRPDPSVTVRVRRRTRPDQPLRSARVRRRPAQTISGH